MLETGRAAALTLRAAAREAGVFQTAPYRHFADKEALLIEGLLIRCLYGKDPV